MTAETTSGPLLLGDTRYSRQEAMPQVGQRGQALISRARVVCIGAGGVKSPLLYYLAAAGVGTLRIIDPDRVELSNLNRQILYTVEDIGANKAQAAAARLRRLNPAIDIEGLAVRATPDTYGELLAGYDVVIEGGESVPERYAVNDYCVRAGVPMIHVSAQYGYGHLQTYVPGSACFRCVFPDLPESHGGPVPVIGFATGIAGSLGAAEVIKLILGRGRPVVNGYATFSGFDTEITTIPAPRRPGCPCGAIREE